MVNEAGVASGDVVLQRRKSHLYLIMLYGLQLVRLVTPGEHCLEHKIHTDSVQMGPPSPKSGEVTPTFSLMARTMPGGEACVGLTGVCKYSRARVSDSAVLDASTNKGELGNLSFEDSLFAQAVETRLGQISLQALGLEAQLSSRKEVDLQIGSKNIVTLNKVESYSEILGR